MKNKSEIRIFIRAVHEQHDGCGVAPTTMYRIMHCPDPWSTTNQRVVTEMAFRTRKDKTVLMLWRAGLPAGKRNKIDKNNAEMIKTAFKRGIMYFAADADGVLSAQRCENNAQVCRMLCGKWLYPHESNGLSLEYRGNVYPPVTEMQLAEDYAFLDAHLRTCQTQGFKPITTP